MKSAFISGICLTGLIACSPPPADTTGPDEFVTETRSTAAAYPLRRQFACLPKQAAFIAAHRGTSIGEGLAENSATSLRALIRHGIIVAEVDVAGLKDGTHILYHDGVWDEKSTGQGAVAASSWPDMDKILLKDTNGDLTADRPVKLKDALNIAKDQLYLEIDFKSSAKYETVIEMVREAGMADRVILIAYNERQAARLAQLAPDMLLSVSAETATDVSALENLGVKRENMAIWMGRGPYNASFADYLAEQGMPVLAWPGKNFVYKDAGIASLIVSDFAMDYDGIVGMDEADEQAYRDCLASESSE